MRNLPCKELRNRKDGDLVRVAGLVLVRQRPGTAKGICFITIEDEGGYSNLVVFENMFEKYRKEILQSKLLMVEGKLQVEKEVIHVIVSRCYNLSKYLVHLTASEDEALPLLTLARADETSAPPVPDKDRRVGKQTKMFYEGRNFK